MKSIESLRKQLKSIKSTIPSQVYVYKIIGTDRKGVYTLISKKDVLLTGTKQDIEKYLDSLHKDNKVLLVIPARLDF